MKPALKIHAGAVFAASLLLTLAPSLAAAADKSLLDALLENGALNQAQYDSLVKQESLSEDDVLKATDASEAESAADSRATVTMDEDVQAAIDDAVESKIVEENPVKASYGSKGFRLETRDGNFQTNLQWRAQFRYSNPRGGDPRQPDDFEEETSSNFEPRRLRMKIGGHGFKPWLKYFFEVDLQPARDVEADPQSSSARVITWQADIAKWEQFGIRLGQWKIDYNRERVDSSGKQQFVERSIVNRIFTIDRQVGIQLMGRLFKETPADMRYYAGIYNGEGRSVENIGDDHMYMGRLQWNFFGRDLKWSQSDTDFTLKPTGSFAVAGVLNNGPCTRWSSSGCGSLDGFGILVDDPNDPSTRILGDYKIEQSLQEFAFKYRGFSVQQEWHRKFITDKVNNSTKYDLTGFYFNTGYFFHGLLDFVPKNLELAARYAYVQEPFECADVSNDCSIDQIGNALSNIDNEREEYTAAINYFFAGHKNKLTLDYSYLTLDDGSTGLDYNDDRVRLQWDVSF
jgi:phosphate-selective porin OprO/OprP